MNKPFTSEYNPYFQKYIDLVPSEEYLENFNANTTDVIAFFENIPLAKHNYKYEPNKWSIKQVLMHIIDTERVFAYRLLVILRKDETTVLQPYDDDLYASNVNVDNREMSDILEEFQLVRKNTAFLLKEVDENQSQLTAKIDQNPISVRAIAYILLGHAKHHLSVITERYL